MQRVVRLRVGGILLPDEMANRRVKTPWQQEYMGSHCEQKELVFVSREVPYKKGFARAKHCIFCLHEIRGADFPSCFPFAFKSRIYVGG